MKLKVFSIFDVKAKCYSNPFVMPHRGLALRSFGDLVADKNTNINHHPEDYKLYELAEWDDNSGQYVSLKQPEFLANASDYSDPRPDLSTATKQTVEQLRKKY